MESLTKRLLSSTSKLEALNDLGDALASGCSTASFLGSLEKLFSGLRSCLLLDDSQTETVLKANNILIDMLPDIQHSDDLEIQFAQLIPTFIENLGSSKAVVRKSTHKCIATYVKVSKKLEFVLLHIIYSGLESQNTRTRQHSMLVIPALLSLKVSVLDRCSSELIDLMQIIIKKLRDPVEIVAKTARKLLIEINKCYPQQFENGIIPSMKSEEEKTICRAVLKMDEEEIQRVASSYNLQASQSNQLPLSRKEESKTYQSNTTVNSSLNLQKGIGNNFQSKELSIVGKEILQGASSTSNQIGSSVVLEKIIYEAKEESRYPKAQNNLYFGILEENVIEALNENNQWKERTSAIEAIESKINIIVMTDKKMDFMPYATAFLGFIIQYISHINFKISLTAIKIISNLNFNNSYIDKLLQMNLINFKKYYPQLVSTLVEKLSDSKVVIRQAVLKCCALIIQNYKPSTFAFHVMRYLQHGNWHVREGALHLIAQCIIVQAQNKSNSNSMFGQVPQTPDSDTPLALNPSLIMEICNLLQTEDKSKNQQYIIDLLALIIDNSDEELKTKLIIQKQLGLQSTFKSDEEMQQQAQSINQMQSKEFFNYKSVIDRLSKGNLPFINEENFVEFPQPSSLQVIPTFGQKHNSVTSGTGQTKDMRQSEDPILSQNSYFQQETLASVKTKAPSESFLEVKRKQEEEKKLQLQQQQQQNYFQKFSQKKEETKQESFENNLIQSKEQDKIAIWLPSFPPSVQDQPISKSVQNSQQARNLRNNQATMSVAKEQISDQFNATSSSVATYLDDGRSYVSGNTYGAKEINNSAAKGSTSAMTGFTANIMLSKSPVITDKLTDQSSSYRQTSQSYQIQPQQNQSYAQQIDNRLSQGYTPSTHNKQPRSIHSNEIRQRTIEPNAKAEQPILYGSTLNDFQYEIPAHHSGLNKNMSSSTGVQGFGYDRYQGPSDKLKLLKSNSKYANNSADSSVSPSKSRPDTNLRDEDSEYPFGNEVSERLKNLNPPTSYAKKQEKMAKGPVRATHHQDFMQTINNEDTFDNNDNSTTPVIGKNKKPPLTNKTTSSIKQPRAQSVDNHLSPTAQPAINNEGSDPYQVSEEPLQQPDKQYQQALDGMKSGDWQKQFDACNIIKRIAINHKQLLSSGNQLQLPIFKELLKLSDSLRSQLAKNALLTIKLVIENIPSKDLDYLIDQILPALLKKAADTNAFISESSDAALIAVCFNLSETKVFNSLQSIQNVKSNPMKIKMAMCYNTLIEKLGPKVRQFSSFEKLVQVIVQFLNEGALEVRNMAKVGLLNLKNAIGNQRELEMILSRCAKDDKQFDKIKQMLDKGDLDSISINGSTRYGSSMRTSSLDKGASQYKGGFSGAAGSDGFGKYTVSSDFNAQSQMKTTGMPSSGSFGFASTTTGAFKKTNNLVSKPIDPIIMEEFKNIINEMSTNDWNKRLKNIDTLGEFVKNNISTIKSAPPAKFIQLIDAYTKVLNDNNAKVLSYAQQAFKSIILNENLKNLIEQNLTMIVQALSNNLQSSNYQAREQGEQLFQMLEDAVDVSLLVPPMVAQINIANNRSKAQLVERLSNIIDRVDKPGVVQKYVGPLIQASNKINAEASNNPKLKDALSKLQVSMSLVGDDQYGEAENSRRRQ